MCYTTRCVCVCNSCPSVSIFCGWDILILGLLLLLFCRVFFSFYILRERVSSPVDLAVNGGRGLSRGRSHRAVRAYHRCYVQWLLQSVLVWSPLSPDVRVITLIRVSRKLFYFYNILAGEVFRFCGDGSIFKNCCRPVRTAQIAGAAAVPAGRSYAYKRASGGRDRVGGGAVCI